jgi:hypothetical protein
VSKENDVRSNSIIAEILHFFIEKRKYDVEAFTIINIGCIELCQYDDIDGSSPIDPMYIKGANAAIIITSILNMKSFLLIAI